MIPIVIYNYLRIPNLHYWISKLDLLACKLGWHEVSPSFEDHFLECTHCDTKWAD